MVVILLTHVSGVDHIDLYYAHRMDRVTPIEKTMEALKQLKQEGKIKYIGLSECSSDTLRRACKVDHVDAIQIEYSCVCLKPVVQINANLDQTVLFGYRKRTDRLAEDCS